MTPRSDRSPAPLAQVAHMLGLGHPEDWVNLSALTPICIPLPKKPCA